MVSRVLAQVRAWAMMYKVVVQMVLFYRSESWVIEDAMVKVFEGFHNKIARRIVGNMDQHVGEEGWECPLEEEALEAAGMWPM